VTPMATDADLERAVHESGRSMSRQRQAVLDALRGTTSHPTAKDIFDEVRVGLPSITLATVYRNLTVLAELGLVKEVEGGGSGTRYDAWVDPHLHIACVVCGRVDDVPVDEQCRLEQPVAAATGYEVLGHTTSFHGICPKCQKETTKKEG